MMLPGTLPTEPVSRNIYGGTTVAGHYPDAGSPDGPRAQPEAPGHTPDAAASAEVTSWPLR
jgi:hypothetical protein